MSEYIKKEDVLALQEVIYPEYYDCDSNYIEECAVDIIYPDVVKRIPPEDVQPVRYGTWEGGELGHCTCCGHKGCASDIWNGVEGSGYCPNCGAKLERNEKSMDSSVEGNGSSISNISSWYEQYINSPNAYQSYCAHRLPCGYCQIMCRQCPMVSSGFTYIDKTDITCNAKKTAK